MAKKLKEAIVWYFVDKKHAHSPVLEWYLTENQAEIAQLNTTNEWQDTAVGCVETYVGSGIHEMAVSNSKC